MTPQGTSEPPNLHVVTDPSQTNPGTPQDLVPTISESRLESKTFSSDLTISQYGACLELGLEPVGFVQGFCAMQMTSWYSSGYWSYANSLGSSGARNATYFRNYSCPHGWVSSEHRTYGYNAEMAFNESGWRNGFRLAYDRMIEEAQVAKAHGVIGVVSSVRNLIDPSIHEFHITGTAVRAKGIKEVPVIFNTFLAGQRLVKIIEAGYMPVSVISTLGEVAMYAYCITEALIEGRYGYGSSMGGYGSMGMGSFGLMRQGGYSPGLGGLLGGGSPVNPMRSSVPSSQGSSVSQMGGGYQTQEIGQLCDAYSAAYQIAETLANKALAGDSLHGADMTIKGYEGGAGNHIVTCTLQGTRVRRFTNFDTMDPPTPVVGLWG